MSSPFLAHSAINSLMISQISLLILLLACTATLFLNNCFVESLEIKSLQRADRLLQLRSGFGGVSLAVEEEEAESEEELEASIIISGSPSHSSHLNGIYYLSGKSVNGRPHYEKKLGGGSSIHLYWSGSQWVLHRDLDPARNYDNLLAYAKVKSKDPHMTTSNWYVKVGKTFEFSPLLGLRQGSQKGHEDEVSGTGSLLREVNENEEILGIPRKLLPYYAAFMLDAVAVGLVMPLLPFTVIELGANAMQLSLVVSANYVAQSIGCVIMGKVSDTYGRKLVMNMCLAASAISYFFLSQANTLVGFGLARIISGSFGGLIPIMQSTVADVAAVADRPKYLGRIMATFGLGFVVGPGIAALLRSWTTRQKICLSSLLPFAGLLITLIFGRETKRNAKGMVASGMIGSKKKTAKIIPKENIPPVPTEIMMLVVNGFGIMYAFATETIYAMFIKDSFGYGEHMLSALFAVNGMFIGLFQVFLIKPLIGSIGKHATLALGNAMLAIGMIGVALIRQQTLHFGLFAAHIVGYSIADTALASLITRYSSPTTQGRDLAFNQAAQACARVVSPLLAGILYEYSKKPGMLLPTGALPFLAGALGPALSIIVPTMLLIRSTAAKRKKLSESSTDEEKANTSDQNNKGSVHVDNNNNQQS